jgi:hypothetical protein
VLKSLGSAPGIMASSFAASSGFNLQEATGPRAPHHLAGLRANMEMYLHARFFSFRFFATPSAVPGDTTLHRRLTRHLLLGICMHCASAGCQNLQSHAATCLSPLQESDASLVPFASAAAVLNSPLATGGTLLVAPDYGHEDRASNGWLEVISPPENGLCSLATENVKASCVVPPALSGLVVHDELLPGLNTDMYRQARKLLQGMPPPKSVFERSEGRLCVAGNAAAAIAAVMSLEAPVQPARCAQHRRTAADNANNRENDMRCARDAANVDESSEAAAAHAREASQSREGLPAKGLPAFSAFVSRGRQPLGEEVYAALLIPHAARYLFCEELRSALEQSERGASDVNADRGRASVEASKASSSGVWGYSGMSLALDSSNDAGRIWPLCLPHRSPDGGCAICERINEVARNAAQGLLVVNALPTAVARLKAVLHSLKSTVQSARLYLAEHHIPAGVIEVNAGDRGTGRSGVLQGGEERAATVQALCASVAAVSKLSSSLTCDGMAAQAARDVEVCCVDALQLRHAPPCCLVELSIGDCVITSDRLGCHWLHKVVLFLYTNC